MSPLLKATDLVVIKPKYQEAFNTQMRYELGASVPRLLFADPAVMTDVFTIEGMYVSREENDLVAQLRIIIPTKPTATLHSIYISHRALEKFGELV